ncbi:MAG: ATP-binding cassette domain-containing protein [Pelagibacteraceae bacterium]
MGSLKKILLVLNKKEKYWLIFITFFMIISAFLEMLGVSFILPILSILLSDQGQNILSNKNELINNFLDFFHNKGLMFSLVILFLLYFAKNLTLFVIGLLKFKFLEDVTVRISNNIFTTYIKKSFLYHTDQNSSRMYYNSAENVDIFTDTLESLITIATDFILILFLVLLLFFIEPTGLSISIFSLGIITFTIHKFIKVRVISLGKRKEIFQNQRIKSLLQGFQAIKDIKVFKKSSYFLRNFFNPNYQRSKIRKTERLYNSIPRLVLELFFIIVLLGLIILLKSQGKSNLDILVVLGFFGVAFIRLLPSVSRCLGSLQLYNFGKKSLNNIYEELILNKEDNNSLDIPKNNISKNLKNNSIVFENTSFKYKNKKDIITNLNLSIKEKEFIGITGDSGSGKSTLGNLILGLIEPTSGNIKINFSKITFVPQSVFLIDDTLSKNIAFGIEDHKIDHEHLNECLIKSELKNFIEKLPDGLDTVVGERGVKISGGELQRIGIARALYPKPEIIIFDEATNSLDVETEEKIVKIMRELNNSITILFISHNLSGLKNCDRVIKINNQTAKDIKL